jgi:hypothetical protein
MVGVARTVKLLPLLATPPTVTTTLPVVAVDGTIAVIAVGVQVLNTLAAPAPNFTVLPAELLPNPLPLMVTVLPTAPDVMERLVMLTTVKLTPLPATPPTVTTTLPVVAPEGTVTLMLVVVHTDAAAAATPLNFTVLEPWGEPKPVPVIVTTVPMVPEVGDRLVIEGAANAAAEKNRNNAIEISRTFFMEPLLDAGNLITSLQQQPPRLIADMSP